MEAILEPSPASALAALDSMGDSIPRWAVPFRMRYELLRAQAMNKAFVGFTTDSVVLKLARYYDFFGGGNEGMAANYMAGCAYRDLGDAPSALKYYRRAVEAADTAGSGCDLRMLCCIHGQSALLYSAVLAFESEMQENQKAEGIARQLGDTANVVVFMWGRAGCHYMQKDYGRTLGILDSISGFWRRHHLREKPELIYPMSVNIMLERKDVAGAGRLLKEFEAKTGVTVETPAADLPIYDYFLLKGQYYVQDAQPDSAIAMFRRSLAHFDTHEYKEVAYRGLKDAYSMKHQPDSAIKYADLYCRLNDSTMLDRSSENLLRMQSLYNYSKMEERAAVLQERNARLLWAVIASALILLIVYVLGREFYRQTRTEQMEAQQRYDGLSAELREAKAEAEQHITEKERKIAELLRTLDTLKSDIMKISEWNKGHGAVNSELIQHLRGQATCGREANSDELISLACFVQYVLPKFYQYINAEEHGLTSREISVCILIRLNFAPGEIAALMGMKPQNVTNIRTSVNRKLFRETGTKNLDGNLAKL